MEQILIEAESQKLLEKHVKSNDKVPEKPTPMEVETATNIESETIKNEEVEDVEMKDAEKSQNIENSESTKNNENNAHNEESEDLTIDIDPKTYCKLGHFHLLLGDFAKGKCKYQINFSHLGFLFIIE